MPRHVIIDGNNLLHAMHAHAPLPHVGRETLVKIIECWAGRGDDSVTLVFDGPIPRGGLSKQMLSSRITVRFSAPATADDIIVGIIHRTRDPAHTRVVTGDTAIRHEAKLRRCLHIGAVAFVDELFASPDEPRQRQAAANDNVRELSPQETQEWLERFGLNGDDPFDVKAQ